MALKLKMRLKVALIIFNVVWPLLTYAQKASNYFDAFHVKQYYGV
jgi:hypothetical protein